MSDRARPGFWLCRLVRGGPLVPCAIVRQATQHEPDSAGNVMDRSPQLVGIIDGEIVHPDKVPWQYGTPIMPDEYRYQVARAEWSRKHAPSEPAANPRERIDMMKTPLPF